MFDDTAKSGKSLRKSPQLKTNGSNKRLSSSSLTSLTTESEDGETGSIKDEQMVPNVHQQLIQASAKPSNGRSEFAFSDLMRKMASKYQASDAPPVSE